MNLSFLKEVMLKMETKPCSMLRKGKCTRSQFVWFAVFYLRWNEFYNSLQRVWWKNSMNVHRELGRPKCNIANKGPNLQQKKISENITVKYKSRKNADLLLKRQPLNRRVYWLCCFSSHENVQLQLGSLQYEDGWHLGLGYEVNRLGKS